MLFARSIPHVGAFSGFHAAALSVICQLYGRECTKEWRADIYLRKLALYVIATNEVSHHWLSIQARDQSASDIIHEQGDDSR